MRKHPPFVNESSLFQRSHYVFLTTPNLQSNRKAKIITSTIIMSLSPSVSVPTFAQKIHNKQQISRKDVASKDLAVLKKCDPFSYFSIPAMRNAELLNEDVDTLTLSTLSRNEASGSLSSVRANESITFYRKSRVSFECHSNLIYEHLLSLNGTDNADKQECQDSEEDLYLVLEGYLNVKTRDEYSDC